MRTHVYINHRLPDVCDNYADLVCMWANEVDDATH